MNSKVQSPLKMRKYPDEKSLRSEWRRFISPWLRNLLKSVADSTRQEAAAVFNTELVDRLLAEEDSAQKVFDMYGVAQFLNLLGDIRRYRDLLVELSRLVPCKAIYFDISRACLEVFDMSGYRDNLEKAYELCPDDVGVLNNLGTALMQLNEKDRGLELLSRSIEIAPNDPFAYSNYLFNLHHSDSLNCRQIFQEHRKWAKANANFVYKTDHINDPDPNRKLRIGYISPDFRSHPVGNLILPVIAYHHRGEFEIFGYSNISRYDKMTGAIGKRFDTYRIITSNNKQEVVDMILEDKIDILIDIAGHTSNNRLDVMAFKPAPVQVTYLGYFDTTGMKQVDYFLTDQAMSPPASQKYHTEKLYCLPDCCIGYDIKKIKTPDVVSSPVIKNGYVTFGMFGKPSKITMKTARLWGEILKKTDNSRLKLMLCCNGSEKEISIYSTLLADCEVPVERVEISGMVPLDKYYAAYSQVDIMLDTHPYSGGMTTSDALWMGVPIISLVGEHHFSRVGLSLLRSVGLEYFATETEQEYIAKACGLAQMPEHLEKIRNSLRQRVLASSTGNPKQHTRNIERAYRDMWRRWCKENNTAV